MLAQLLIVVLENPTRFELALKVTPSLRAVAPMRTDVQEHAIFPAFAGIQIEDLQTRSAGL